MCYYIQNYTAKCIVCHVALNEHQSRICRTTSDLCCRCFNSGHSSKECLLPTISIAGTCPRCYLPTSIGNQIPTSMVSGCAQIVNRLSYLGLSFLNFVKRREVNHDESRDSHGMLDAWKVLAQFGENVA